VVCSNTHPDIIADQRLKAVTLTGSEWAGSQVAMAAGKHLKKTVLELGGSDPFIVLEDADIVEAAEIAVKARMLNCGQSCIAAKRFIIVQNRYDQFVETFEEQLKSLTLGDPVKPGVHYGPMARKDLAADLDQQMTKSIAKGATQVFPEVHAGAMFPANMLLEVVPGMPAFDEELFGPVAAMIRAKDENEAIELANLTKFGLGASVWTTDVDRGQQVARKIDAGSVFINKMVVSHPGIPFGGIKMSGYGRELAHLGLREFVNHTSIVY
jgi:succinate-semialdehyde dehydrogenase/glutarate-semialdehyde dehydrogenase